MSRTTSPVFGVIVNRHLLSSVWPKSPATYFQYCNIYKTRHYRLVSSLVNTRDDRNHHKRGYYGLKWLKPVLSAAAVCVGYNWKTDCFSEDKSSKNLGDEDETISNSNGISSRDKSKRHWDEAIATSRELCQRVKDETASPGLSVAVFIDGKEVWSEGLGYADVENRVPCQPNSVMRIASISKPITTTIIAKLWEESKIDLDKPIQHYVSAWPEKTYKGEMVTITTRQLLSHMAGIRHYDKTCGKKDNKKNKPDFFMKEFYNKNQYNTVTEALDIFKNDELCSLPGTEYLYTTYGWTLLSAVAEGASNKTFPILVKDLLHDLGMENTYLDENQPIIYNRARNYEKNKNGRIVNAPYVDCSCKWAGGGLLSTVRDISRFGSAMLYAYQHNTMNTTPDQKPGYLNHDTMRILWKPVSNPNYKWHTDIHYGMGWDVMELDGRKYGGCREMARFYSHTGGAVGCSSALIVMPRDIAQCDHTLPQGVVVTIIVNMTAVGLAKCALKIAKVFGEAALAIESN